MHINSLNGGCPYTREALPSRQQRNNNLEGNILLSPVAGSITAIIVFVAETRFITYSIIYEYNLYESTYYSISRFI